MEVNLYKDDKKEKLKGAFEKVDNSKHRQFNG